MVPKPGENKITELEMFLCRRHYKKVSQDWNIGKLSKAFQVHILRQEGWGMFQEKGLEIFQGKGL